MSFSERKQYSKVLVSYVIIKKQYLMEHVESNDY